MLCVPNCSKAIQLNCKKQYIIVPIVIVIYVYIYVDIIQYIIYCSIPFQLATSIAHNKYFLMPSFGNLLGQLGLAIALNTCKNIHLYFVLHTLQATQISYSIKIIS